MGRGEPWGTDPTPGAEGMGKVPLEGHQGPPGMGCTRVPPNPNRGGGLGRVLAPGSLG